MSDYTTDIAKFTGTVDEDAVEEIVKYCGIALRSRDAAMVSGSDPHELETIRDGFAAKKLGLAPESADAAISAVAEKMKVDHSKSRVTFYYLLAEATGTLPKLSHS